MRSQNIQKDLSLIGDNLINKFIQKDKILDGIIDHFYEEKNILKKSIDKKDVFLDENRKVLVDQLKKQYSKVKLYKETSKNINSLIDSNTFTITTGHQLNLFTGPLMVIYKIAQVISMARYLNSKSICSKNSYCIFFQQLFVCCEEIANPCFFFRGGWSFLHHQRLVQRRRIRS